MKKWWQIRPIIMQAQKINTQIVYNIHTIIYIKDNLVIKRNNNDDKINKLSKNMLTICLASCIIKIH